MTLTDNSPEHAESLDGQMFLYQQPELLNQEEHGALGLKSSDRPFEFAREARFLPLTLPELPRAHLWYPIVFADAERSTPLAVVGAGDGVNLFVDENGRWEAGAYVPAYVRRYPFALAKGPADQYAVVIDRAAGVIGESPDQPFFDEGKITPGTQSIIDFCGRYDAEAKMTAEFGDFLRDNGLLSKQQATQTWPDGAQQPVANYYAVDEQRLRELQAEKLEGLLKNGYLACIFAHRFSLENWPRLVERHTLRVGASAT